jgi:hypothetical protein
MSTTTVHIVATGPGRFGVQVTEGDVTTSHEVEVPPEILDELGLAGAGESIDEVAEQVVRETFAFLLEREPATSILRTFSLTDVSRYFPEFFDELQTRLAGTSG